jgi:hypothetical protein
MGEARRRLSSAPVFHVPVGRTRDEHGKVVLFADVADQEAAMRERLPAIHCHPKTLAAVACVVIGTTVTSYVDVRSRQVVQSRTAKGAWQPGAVSDLDVPAQVH